MSQEVLADSVDELLAQQVDEGESSPEPELAEGMNIDYPSEQHEHELARQETNRSRLSSRVTRQSEVNEQDEPQAHNAQDNEQGPFYTAQERLVWCEGQICSLLYSPQTSLIEGEGCHRSDTLNY